MHCKKRKISIYIIANIIIAIGLQACDFPQQKDSKKVADMHNKAKFHNINREREAHFLVETSEAMLNQIYMAQLAKKNSIQAEIQQTGERIEKEYIKSLDTLKEITAMRTITLPADISLNNKKIYNKLNEAIAGDFDKAYFKIALKNHESMIHLSETTIPQLTDTAVKNWARNNLELLQKNLDILTSKQRTLAVN